ncbi:uncharacterized protein LOC135391924 [Ornithodoros turicata]|uniref:uncharacterized protein LOC135391924 n=1 Tax=Ornithodoros turicata TaxID=34597 RepID=UPI00313A3977
MSDHPAGYSSDLRHPSLTGGGTTNTFASIRDTDPEEADRYRQEMGVSAPQRPPRKVQYDHQRWAEQEGEKSSDRSLIEYPDTRSSGISGSPRGGRVGSDVVPDFGGAPSDVGKTQAGDKSGKRSERLREVLCSQWVMAIIYVALTLLVVLIIFLRRKTGSYMHVMAQPNTTDSTTSTSSFNHT